jgi:DNA-binding transcriptional LysR family regulator
VNLQQLAYFREAVAQQSFSAAAKTLHLAQPSLSEQIRRLEGELGVPLFLRVGRGVVPTEAGRALLPHAERVLAEVEAAREAVRGVRDVRAGTASFGTFSTAVYYLLADLAEAFTERYPGVRLRIVGLNSSAVAADVRAGRLEAGLVVLPVDAEGLDVQPALRDELLYVSAEPHRVRRPVTARELARRPMIFTDASHAADDPTRLQIAARAQEAGVAIEPIVEVEYLSAALDLAARGVGDVLVPAVVTRNRRFPSGLQSVRFAERVYDTFAFVTRRGATLSPATAALLELAEGLLQELGEDLPGGADPPEA